MCIHFHAHTFLHLQIDSGSANNNYTPVLLLVGTDTERGCVLQKSSARKKFRGPLDVMICMMNFEPSHSFSYVQQLHVGSCSKFWIPRLFQLPVFLLFPFTCVLNLLSNMPSPAWCLPVCCMLEWKFLHLTSTFYLHRSVVISDRRAQIAQLF